MSRTGDSVGRYVEAIVEGGVESYGKQFYLQLARWLAGRLFLLHVFLQSSVHPFTPLKDLGPIPFLPSIWTYCAQDPQDPSPFSPLLGLTTPRI